MDNISKVYDKIIQRLDHTWTQFTVGNVESGIIFATRVLNDWWMLTQIISEYFDCDDPMFESNKKILEFISELNKPIISKSDIELADLIQYEIKPLIEKQKIEYETKVIPLLDKKKEAYNGI